MAELRGVRRVQKFKSGFELLRPRGKRVLELLGAGNKASDVAKVIGCGKSGVSYWKTKLLGMAALRLQCHDVYDVFSLTPFGSKLLTGSEEGRFAGEVFVLEDHAVKFEIVEHEKTSIDWRKLGQPQNWVKLGFKVGNVRVVKTSRSIIVHPGKLKGFDVDELEVAAGQIIERARIFLENRFGMVLGEEAVPLHKPVWQVFSPEAEEWAKAGTVKVDGVGRLDKSPPDRRAHREYDQKQLAVDAVRVPVILANLEYKIDSLATEIHELVSVLRELAAQPQGLRDPRSKNLSYVS